MDGQTRLYHYTFILGTSLKINTRVNYKSIERCMHTVDTAKKIFTFTLFEIANYISNK